MNKQEIINECRAELSQIRANAERVAEETKLKALKIKEYRELDTKERELTFMIGKKSANNMDASEENAYLKRIRDEKIKILAKNGINPKHLSPMFYCNKCEDTGYVNGSMCQCLSERINNKILKECQSEARPLAHFDEFRTDIITDEKHKTTLLKLKAKLESIADGFPESSPRFMILSGPTGVGKTFLSECLASELISKGYVATFISAFSMNNIFLSYIKAPVIEKKMYLSSLLDPDLLIVDDLGTEPILRNVTLEYLYLILSERSRQGKLTLFTTNLDLGDILDRYGERIFSRLVNKNDSFNTHISGQDLRLRG